MGWFNHQPVVVWKYADFWLDTFGRFLSRNIFLHKKSSEKQADYLELKPYLRAGGFRRGQSQCFWGGFEGGQLGTLCLFLNENV